jgi:hypothetical protein
MVSLFTPVTGEMGMFCRVVDPELIILDLVPGPALQKLESSCFGSLPIFQTNFLCSIQGKFVTSIILKLLANLLLRVNKSCFRGIKKKHPVTDLDPDPGKNIS